MKVDLYNILNFCKKYKKIICYGAADYGYLMKHFLEKNGIKVEFFLVSNVVERRTIRDGIEMYSIKSVKKIEEDYGIVLSLLEIYQTEVIDNLKKYLNRTSGIYLTSEAEFKKIRLVSMNAGRMVELEKKPTEDFSEYDFYKMRKILEKYNRINVGYFEAKHMGNFVTWCYLLYQRKKNIDEIFWLYYPVTSEHLPKRKFCGANGYLLGKLTTDGMEVISEKNINFWRYFYKNNKHIFTFLNEYHEHGFYKDMCMFNGKIPFTTSYIHLDDEEMILGGNIINQNGIVDKFVCIYARDMAYTKKLKGDVMKENINDRYRNSDINYRKSTVDYLKQRDILAVRVGSIVEKPINYPNFLDYTAKFRSEFMDVFLSMECKFFLGDLSGIIDIPMLFSKPLAITNVPLLTTYFDGPVFFSPDKDIAILKKLWNKRCSRYLTIREMLEIEVSQCNNEKYIQGVFKYYQRNEVVPIENTSEEILALAREMNERLDNNYTYDEIDIKLQKRYRDLVDNYPKKDNVLSRWRLGADFLRNNQWLLD